MKEVVLPLDKSLRDGELLIYKNGKVYSVEIHELLPEFKRLDKRLDEIDERIKKNDNSIVELAQIIKEK